MAVPYDPRPLDDPNIPDPPHFDEFVERLARNAHEVWAQKRLAEGWTYGEKRDDEARKTPFLVPYESLPESEKETDRVMVRGVLRAALSLGCKVELPSPPCLEGDLDKA